MQEIKKEQKILDCLMAGHSVRKILSAVPGSNWRNIQRVRNRYADQLPDNKFTPTRYRQRPFKWSVWVDDNLNSKMLAEIHKRGITLTELLNEIIEGWYER